MSINTTTADSTCEVIKEFDTEDFIDFLKVLAKKKFKFFVIERLMGKSFLQS
jgi:hypothetical protein